MTRADDLGDNAALTPNDALGDVHATEEAGPHGVWCPMSRPKFWRARHDPFATCHCSNAFMRRVLSGRQF